MDSFQYVSTPSEFARAQLLHGLIGGYDAPNGNFLFAREYYPAYEIMLVTQGKGAFKHGAQWIDIIEGDCVIQDMRLPHAYRTRAEDPFEMYYLVFDGIDMEYFWPKLFGGASYAILQSLPQQNAILQLLEVMIISMKDEDASGNELPLSVRIYELLMEVYRHKRDAGLPAPAGSGPEPESLKRAKTYMDSHYLEVEDVSQLASVAALSLYHFIRQFKKQYGITPKEYVLLKKVHHAKRLLINTSLPIGEVGQQSGFASYNAFLHAFLKIQHDSPREFRRNWRRHP